MDRFDLEEQICKGYNLSQNLKDLSEGVSELSPDEISNALIGLSIMIDLHTSKSMDIFKQVFKLDEYKYV